jgi:hypothetical protein
MSTFASAHLTGRPATTRGSLTRGGGGTNHRAMVGYCLYTRTNPGQRSGPRVPSGWFHRTARARGVQQLLGFALASDDSEWWGGGGLVEGILIRGTAGLATTGLSSGSFLPLFSLGSSFRFSPLPFSKNIRLKTAGTARRFGLSGRLVPPR